MSADLLQDNPQQNTFDIQVKDPIKHGESTISVGCIQLHHAQRCWQKNRMSHFIYHGTLYCAGICLIQGLHKDQFAAVSARSKRGLATVQRFRLAPRSTARAKQRWLHFHAPVMSHLAIHQGFCKKYSAFCRTSNMSSACNTEFACVVQVCSLPACLLFTSSEPTCVILVMLLEWIMLCNSAWSQRLSLSVKMGLRTAAN